LTRARRRRLPPGLQRVVRVDNHVDRWSAISEERTAQTERWQMLLNCQRCILEHRIRIWTGPRIGRAGRARADIGLIYLAGRIVSVPVAVVTGTTPSLALCPSRAAGRSLRPPCSQSTMINPRMPMNPQASTEPEASEQTAHTAHSRAGQPILPGLTTQGQASRVDRACKASRACKATARVSRRSRQGLGLRPCCMGIYAI
jgi:hypothetical protein